MKDSYQLPSEGGLISGADPEDMISRWEKVRTRVTATATEGVEYIVSEIAAGIEKNHAAGKPYVMALTSGASSVGIYGSLVEKHLRGEVSFADVVHVNPIHV